MLFARVVHVLRPKYIIRSSLVRHVKDENPPHSPTRNVNAHTLTAESNIFGLLFIHSIAVRRRQHKNIAYKTGVDI